MLGPKKDTDALIQRKQYISTMYSCNDGSLNMTQENQPAKFSSELNRKVLSSSLLNNLRQAWGNVEGYRIKEFF